MKKRLYKRKEEDSLIGNGGKNGREINLKAIKAKKEEGGEGSIGQIESASTRKRKRKKG